MKLRRSADTDCFSNKEIERSQAISPDTKTMVFSENSGRNRPPCLWHVKMVAREVSILNDMVCRARLNDFSFSICHCKYKKIYRKVIFSFKDQLHEIHFILPNFTVVNRTLNCISEN